MKFNYCITNPPYKGKLHLKILYRIFDFSEQIISVEPAGFLINLNENSLYNKPNGLSDNIKKKMEHHTKYICIDNLNLEFGTAMASAFGIYYIDFTKTYEELSNYIFNVTHCKLFCFVQICLNISATSSTGPFTPWIADRHYTDEQLYNLLNINKQEQTLIDETLKLYSADTEFFQNYFRIGTAYENKK